LQRFRRRDIFVVPFPPFFPSRSRVRTDQLGEKSPRLLWAGSTTSPESRWLYPLRPRRSGKGSGRICPGAITADDTPGNARTVQVHILAPGAARSAVAVRTPGACRLTLNLVSQGSSSSFLEGQGFHPEWIIPDCCCVRSLNEEISKMCGEILKYPV
jgi:hypothetical protein